MGTDVRNFSDRFILFLFILVVFVLSEHLFRMLSYAMYLYWYPDRCLTGTLYPQEIVRINYLFLLL